METCARALVHQWSRWTWKGLQITYHVSWRGDVSLYMQFRKISKAGRFSLRPTPWRSLVQRRRPSAQTAAWWTAPRHPTQPHISIRHHTYTQTRVHRIDTLQFSEQKTYGGWFLLIWRLNWFSNRTICWLKHNRKPHANEHPRSECTLNTAPPTKIRLRTITSTTRQTSASSSTKLI